MKITVVDLDLSENDKAWADNRAKLSVPGQPVIARIENNGNVSDDIRAAIPSGYYASTVEVYPDGQMNIFLRVAKDIRADKLIQVRKED